jgi:heparin binding hemagglutinin HbhA
MPTAEDIRRTVTESTPLRAAVGAADLTVERVRDAIANASQTQARVEERLARMQHSLEARVTGFDPQQFRARLGEALAPKSLQATAQQLPALAVSRAIEVAGIAEARYESLAERGKELMERLRTQKATQDLISQGKVTLSRTKAAVTTARRAVDETAAAAREAVGVGRHEVAETVAATEERASEAVEATKKAAGDASAKSAKRATTARSTAKGAASSARKTGSAAKKAAAKAAEKLGD